MDRNYGAAVFELNRSSEEIGSAHNPCFGFMCNADNFPELAIFTGQSFMLASVVKRQTGGEAVAVLAFVRKSEDLLVALHVGVENGAVSRIGDLER